MRYYQQDALGSVVALTDETGTVKTTYIYDPFGNTTVIGEPSDNPFQYTGRENDNTGLYYYRARYYSPELQRFISEDPIRLLGGINLYAYVGNNPVNFVDPLGLWTIQLGFSGQGGAGGGGQAGAGIVFGYSKEKGWQFGTYEVVGSGGYGGVSGSVTFDVSYSPNTDINQLAGVAGTVGGSVSVGAGKGINIGSEVNIMQGGAKPSYTFSIGMGWGIPIEEHGFVTKTRIQDRSKKKTKCK